MSFKLITPLNTVNCEDKAKATSLVTTKGALFLDSVTTGALALAVADTTANQVLWLANETIAAAEALTKVHSYKLVGRMTDVFLVDTVNNSDAAHNGQRMILGAAGVTLNNTGTDSAVGVFQQLMPVGAAASKQILAMHV